MSAARDSSHWSTYNAGQHGRPPRPLLVDVLSLAGHGAGRRAIDLGCGAGVEVAALLAAGWSVHALDSDAKSFADLHPTTDENLVSRLHTQVADLNDLPTLAEADLIYAGYALPYTRPTRFDAMWTTVLSSLRPGGWLAVNLFGDRDSWADDPEETFFTETEGPPAVPGAGGDEVSNRGRGRPRLQRPQALARVKRHRDAPGPVTSTWIRRRPATRPITGTAGALSLVRMQLGGGAQVRWISTVRSVAHRSWLALVVIDVADLDRGARFWAGALRGRIVQQAYGEGIYLTVLVPTEAGEAGLLMQKVPEPKTAKARVHLDIGTDNLDAEVARLESLGARRLRGVEERGLRFWVLADPDGNEFCVVPGERDDDWPSW